MSGYMGLGQTLLEPLDTGLWCADGLPADLENLPGGGVAYTCPEDLRLPAPKWPAGFETWMSRNQTAILIGAAVVIGVVMLRRRR